METVLEIILYVIVGFFVLTLFYELFFVKPKGKDKKNDANNILFNADVHDDSKPAKEIFEALEQDDIKPNFLGHEEKQ